MKTIPLTQGREALVDDSDYEYLTQWRWHYHSNRRSSGYARSAAWCNGRRRVIYLHRIVAERCGLSMGTLIDHRDGNGLNNRRSNLRSATNQQNVSHQKRQRRNTSGFKGVSWKSACGKWEAYIGPCGRKKHLGYFDDPRDAARAYNEAALKYFGEYSWLNPV